MNKYDWEIHFVANDVECECCGKKIEILRKYMCDAHTHGLDKYGSPELQIVLNVPLELIGYTLNSVGEMIRDGLKLEDGMTLEGLFQDDLKLKVFLTKDTQGKDIFRLIFPDSDFRFPEESEQYPYSEQYGSPYLDEVHEGRLS